jgi:hypothetical protein
MEGLFFLIIFKISGLEVPVKAVNKGIRATDDR